MHWIALKFPCLHFFSSSSVLGFQFSFNPGKRSGPNGNEEHMSHLFPKSVNSLPHLRHILHPKPAWGKRIFPILISLESVLYRGLLTARQACSFIMSANRSFAWSRLSGIFRNPIPSPASLKRRSSLLFILMGESLDV